MIFGQMAIGTIFLIAGGSKVADRGSFGAFIGKLGVPLPASRHLIRFVIVSELTAGLSLLAGWQVLGGAILAAVLSCGFVGTLLLAHARRLELRCGCFGALDGDQPQWLQIARAALMVLFSVVIALQTAIVIFSPIQMSNIPFATRVLAVASGVAFTTTFVLFGQIMSFERGRKAVLSSLPKQERLPVRIFSKTEK